MKKERDKVSNKQTNTNKQTKKKINKALNKDREIHKWREIYKDDEMITNYKTVSKSKLDVLVSILGQTSHANLFVCKHFGSKEKFHEYMGGTST